MHIGLQGLLLNNHRIDAAQVCPIQGVTAPAAPSGCEKPRHFEAVNSTLAYD